MTGDATPSRVPILGATGDLALALRLTAATHAGVRILGLPDESHWPAAA